MSDSVDRREFLYALGLGAAALAAEPTHSLASSQSQGIKPIAGSWFEFQHHATVEGVDWNPACARFTSDDWKAKVREMADAGMEYLVLMATALYYRSFYDSKIYPKWQLACPDPLEAVLSAADSCNVKFFIGSGFYGNWQSSKTISDPVANRQRLQSMEELVARYGHHRSFHGWYWPDEASIAPYFASEFLTYVKALSHVARQLKPGAPIMIAPYGTRVARPDDAYVRQLEAIDVDIIAYQDEVGVRKSKVAEIPAIYYALRKAHNRVPRVRMWADIELFDFEGEVYNSPLQPAPFERVLRQMQAVSPWVDTILGYQYLGLMNRPDTPAFAGATASATLYRDYTNWRRREFAR